MANSRHGYQKKKPMNPAMKQALQQKRIESQLKAAYEQGARQGLQRDKFILINALKEAGVDKDDIKVALTKFDAYVDAVLFDELTTTSDIIDQIRERGDFKVTDEELIEYMPDIASYFGNKTENASEE